MKVHNIRLGHATNSSSSHSIIFEAGIKARDNADGDFGWNFFTAASRESRDEYMAHMLRQNLDRTMSLDLIEVIMKGLGLPRLSASSYGIDHQSLYILPKNFNSEGPSIEFFNEFREFMLKDGIVILGGNDNTDEEHELYSAEKEVTFDKWHSEGNQMICRKDGDWWTLFDRDSGTRAVFSFKDNPEPFKPETPMLIDVKITDFCTAGCAYCYQGSTPSGKHAESNDLMSLGYFLSDAEVFEVAIGGGEPTEHPAFLTLLEVLKRYGVVPNFTTRSTKWLEDEVFSRKVLDNVGAFAFSVDGSNTPDMERIVDIFKYRKYDMKKLNLQVIPAVVSEYSFKVILRIAAEARIRVTLLGYKDSGRGGKYRSVSAGKSIYRDVFDENKWLDVLKELQENKDFWLPSISIDTTLAATHIDKLKASGIPEYLYHTQEGKYSMYLDMVDMRYGPSSYHVDLLKSQYTPLDTRRSAKSTIEEMFKSITPV